MNIINFFLEFLIVFSIFACLTVITSTNPVIAIIYLIGVFLSAAIYLIFVGLNFIGISYIIVYCGAIVVVFLFVIMLININLLDIIETGSEYNKNLPIIFTIAIIFTFYFFMSLVDNNLNFLQYFLNSLTKYNALFGLSENYLIDLEILTPFNNNEIVEQTLNNLSQIEILGSLIYTNFAVFLLIISIILLLAMVATICLLVTENKTRN